MSVSTGIYEQALLAVICEAHVSGVNLSTLKERVSAGIMGNKRYTTVGVSQKTEVMDILENSFDEANTLITT